MGGVVSGSKDLGTFKLNFDSDDYPPYTSITHEGSFYQYYFETGEEKEHIFSTKYSTAVSKDPISNLPEYYLSIGLNSKFDGTGIKTYGRPPLNLVILIDVSGSMGSPFTSGETKSKLEVAKETLFSLIDMLRPDDSLGVISFESEPQTIQTIKRLSDIDVPLLKAEIRKLNANGGTTLSNSTEAAINELQSVMSNSNQHYLNHILNLTDATPSSADEDSNKLLEIMHKAAKNHIYKTFIGMGVDFNTQLVSKLTSVKGCSYFSVETSAEFRKMILEDFDYIMFPVAFDISITLKSGDMEVERIYGSPGHEFPSSTGECVQILSVFPSAKEEPTTTKGGIILLKLKSNGKLDSDKKINLSLKYVDYQNNIHTSEENITFPKGDTVTYEDTGVRKAILLTRYVNLMKHWIADSGRNTPSVTKQVGIPSPDVIWEGEKTEKTVSNHYKDIFTQFLNHLHEEAEALGDTKLLTDCEEKLSSLISFVSISTIEEAFNRLILDSNITTIEAVNKIGQSLGITLTNSNEKVVSGLLEKKVWEKAENLLKTKYIDEDKSRLVSKPTQQDIDAWLVNKLQTNEIQHLRPMETRFNNFLVYDYLLLKSKDLKQNFSEEFQQKWNITFDPFTKEFLNIVEKSTGEVVDTKTLIEKVSNKV